MFSLSKDPALQRIQLNELLERSAHALLTLTAPVKMYSEDELIQNKSEYWGNGERINYYTPPSTRFAKLSTYSTILEGR